MSNTLYVRFYASDSRYWDDSVGHVIAAETVDILNKHVEHCAWKEHPYETYEIDLGNPKIYFYGNLYEAKETDD